MKLIVLQTALVAFGLGVSILVRLIQVRFRGQREKLQIERERQQQEALIREWKVGIPYDPDFSNTGKHGRRPTK